MPNPPTATYATHSAISLPDALRALGGYVQLLVLSHICAEPPAHPADGDRYIVPTHATGVWTGHGHKIALWHDDAWSLFAPAEGWHATVGAEGTTVIFDGVAWRGVLAN